MNLTMKTIFLFNGNRPGRRYTDALAKGNINSNKKNRGIGICPEASNYYFICEVASK